nr:hypothetical protein [uncultured Dongia sp.]
MILAGGIVLLLSVQPTLAWESAHGDRDNSGFTYAQTALIRGAPLTIPNIGTFATGVAPVTAPDGSVFIGNEQGKMLAFRADGTPYWQRDLTRGFSIRTSAVVGRNGAVYVIGSKTVRDHRVTPTVERTEIRLFAFTSGGGLPWQLTLPTYSNASGAGHAPPNIWQFGDMEAVMVPVTYRNKYNGGYDTRLFAVSTSGGLMGMVHVGSVVPRTTADVEDSWHNALCKLALGGCALIPGFHINLGPPPPYRLPEGTALPFPGMSVEMYPTAGQSPLMVVSDGFQNVVGYRFSGAAFSELFRVTDESYFRTMLSPPMGSLISTAKGLQAVSGVNTSPRMVVKDLRTEIPVTRLFDGRIVAVMRHGALKIIEGNVVTDTIPLEGETVVSAAASLNHIFVSTENAFLTFDIATLQKVSEINWVGGGMVAPAIGRNGWVYAMASNILFVFPPLGYTNPLRTTTPVGGGLVGPGMSGGTDAAPSPAPPPVPSQVPSLAPVPGFQLSPMPYVAPKPAIPLAPTP